MINLAIAWTNVAPRELSCAAIRGLLALGIPDIVYRICPMPNYAGRLTLKSRLGRASAVDHWVEVGVLGVPERDLPVIDGNALFEDAFGQLPDLCLAVPLPRWCISGLRRRVLADPHAWWVGALIVPPGPEISPSAGALLDQALQDLFNALLVGGISRVSWSEALSALRMTGRVIVASGSAGGVERASRAAKTALDVARRQLRHGQQVEGVLTLNIVGGVRDFKSVAKEYVAVKTAIAGAFSHPDVYREEALLYPLDDFDGLRVTLFVAVGP